MNAQALDLVSVYPTLVVLVRRWARALTSAGIAVDDAVQDVAVALVERQHRRSAYDPTRGSVRAYVRCVTDCTVLSLLRRRRELPGTRRGDDLVDVALEAVAVPRLASYRSALDRLEATALEHGLPPRWLPVVALAAGGLSRSEVAQALDVSPATASRALAAVRTALSEAA